MKRTETQKEFQRQMQGLQPKKKKAFNFFNTKLFRIARLLVVIIVFLWLVSLFDSSINTLLNYYR